MFHDVDQQQLRTAARTFGWLVLLIFAGGVALGEFVVSAASHLQGVRPEFGMSRLNLTVWLLALPLAVLAFVYVRSTPGDARYQLSKAFEFWRWAAGKVMPVSLVLGLLLGAFDTFALPQLPVERAWRGIIAGGMLAGVLAFGYWRSAKVAKDLLNVG